MLLLQLPSAVALLERVGCAPTVCGTCSRCSVFSRLSKACHFFNNLNIVMKCHVGLLTFLHSFVSEFLESQFSEHDSHF